MDCCWEVGRSAGISTNFSLIYTRRMVSPLSWIHGRSDLEGNETVGSCFKQLPSGDINGGRIPQQCCKISTGYAYARDIASPEFSIQLQSENAIGLNKSGIWTEYPLNWIKPTLARNLSLEVEKKDATYILTARWLPPDMLIKNFEYRLRYRTTPGDGTWQIFENVKAVTKSFEVRRSHCLVEVQVAAAPDEQMFKGYFSEYCKSAYNSTGVIRPMTRLRFQSIKSDIFDDTLVISVRWIEYGRTDETGFHYRIEIYFCNGNKIGSENISETRTSLQRTINPLAKCINVTGSYCNVMGCSNATSVEMRPGEVSYYGADVWLEDVDNSLVVTWNFSLPVDSSIACMVRVLSIYRQWENRTEYKIRKAIKEKKVPCWSGNLLLSKHLSVCMEYIALVSTNKVTEKRTYGRSFRSGITRLAQIAGDDIAAGPIAWEASATNDGNIQAIWSGRHAWNCHKVRPRLIYKSVNESDCLHGAEACGTEYVSAALRCEGATILTESIVGKTTYEIRMVPCCINKFSYETGKPICLQTTPADYFKKITTAETSSNRLSPVSIASSVLGIILMTAAAGYTISRRRAIKHVVKQRLWPKVPGPNLAVEFHAMDNDAGMMEMEIFQRVLVQPCSLGNNEQGERCEENPLSHLLPEENNSGQECGLAANEESPKNNILDDVTGHASDAETSILHEDSVALLKTAHRDDEFVTLPPFGCILRQGMEEEGLLPSTSRWPSNENMEHDVPNIANVAINSEGNAVDPEDMAYASSYSIPPYLSCLPSNVGNTHGCDHLHSTSGTLEPTGCQTSFSTLYAQNYAFFDSSWDESSQICTSNGVMTENPLLFSLRDANLN